jgi:hypothetical protein
LSCAYHGASIIFSSCAVAGPAITTWHLQHGRSRLSTNTAGFARSDGIQAAEITQAKQATTKFTAGKLKVWGLFETIPGTDHPCVAQVHKCACSCKGACRCRPCCQLHHAAHGLARYWHKPSSAKKEWPWHICPLCQSGPSKRNAYPTSCRLREVASTQNHAHNCLY